MRRLFSLLACIFLFGITASAQNETRFTFRDGRAQTFVVESEDGQPAAKNEKKKWLRIRSVEKPDQVFESSDRIALQVKAGSDVTSILGQTALKVIQQVNETTFVLQGADAEIAAWDAEQLSKHPDVVNSTPVMRSLTLGLQTLTSAKPNDPLYPNLWHLENDDYPGVDLNIRKAWPLSRGDSVTLAIADQAVDISHPEFASRAQASLHFNFLNDSSDLMLTDKDTHATAVAGLALAARNNSMGIVGVAPESSFASWRIFTTNGAITDDQHLMNMFQYQSHNVAVQIHSWASTTRSLYSVGMLTREGINQAIANGRGGKGVVMVRSAGNRRLGGFEGGAYVNLFGNANDDGFCADPNVIVVAAARADGRVARYSSPGANVLVAGFSNESFANDTTTIDPNFPALTTTGPGGSYTNFTGTSGAVPQIAGLASLILSVNPTLTYRDVQQILLLSSRHFDLADPDVGTNGVGLPVSHNLGFGIPDARTAVYFAKAWNNRPGRVHVALPNSDTKTIPDPGFLIEAEGSGVPLDISSVPAQVPRQSQHPEVGPGEFRPPAPASSLPVVFVGHATNITQNLTGKCALIQRGGGVSFSLKIQRAEAAGASMVIIFNNTGDDSLQNMNLTNFPSIPSAFIGYTAGNALAEQSVSNPNLRVRLRSEIASYSFNVSDQLSLEHVGVKMRTDNLRRSDLRITLTSPQGTQSILQRANNDPSTNAPIDWTYISNQHFYESSVGTWTLSLSDEIVGGATGVVYSVELQLHGVQIADSDADGLDDNSELTHFGNLAQSPSADPDGDGFSHLHELLIGSNPNVHSKPVITQQPVHRVSNVGGTVSFDVEAEGMAPLLYQWKFNGANLAGATQSQLTLNNIQSSQEGTYSVEISNLAGSTLSSNAQLGLFTCTFTTLATQTNFPIAGGTGSISITASNGCSWSVASTNDWIRFTSSTDGSGNGTVHFSIPENFRASRSARLLIGGNAITISQMGAFLPETIAGQSFTFVPGSTSGGGFIIVVYHDGSAFRLIPLNGTDAIENGSIVYTMNSDGTATIVVDGTQMVLTFTSASTGTFVVNDAEGLSGAFSMLETGPDFNEDGYVDLLFQNTNRVLFTWLMKGSAFQQKSLLRHGKPFANNWRTAGTSDFNQDGNPDILLQDTSNRIAIWLMDGTQLSSSVLVRNGNPIGSGWKSAGIADFNGDGSKDILFQRDTGSLAVWLLNSTSFLGSASLRNGQPAGNGWRVFAAGDMNGDRKPDVLLHNILTGKVAVWYFEGLTYTGVDLLRNGQPIGLQWRAAGVADLNNDGKLDVLFQNKSGSLAAWLMNGKEFLSAISIKNGQPVGQGGKLVGPK